MRRYIARKGRRLAVAARNIGIRKRFLALFGPIGTIPAHVLFSPARQLAGPDQEESVAELTIASEYAPRAGQAGGTVSRSR